MRCLQVSRPNTPRADEEVGQFPESCYIQTESLVNKNHCAICIPTFNRLVTKTLKTSMAQTLLQGLAPSRPLSATSRPLSAQSKVVASGELRRLAPQLTRQVVKWSTDSTSGHNCRDESSASSLHLPGHLNVPGEVGHRFDHFDA